MAEHISFQPIEPEHFQPPTLEQRAPEYKQERLGDPTADGWALQPLDHGKIMEIQRQQRVDAKNQEFDKQNSVTGRIRTRLHTIRENYGYLSEKQKNNLQLGAMAVLPTLLPAKEILTNGDAKENAELFLKAYGSLGFAGLWGAAAYKFNKYGPFSKSNQKR
jgi:hypothetical protein